MAHDERYRQWWGRSLRASASPAAAAALLRMNAEIDVRHVLSAIRIPTLILHSVNDRAVDVGSSRYMAERIPGAKFVELQGPDHTPWGSDSDRITDEIEEFLTGERHSAEVDRILATVMFTDIVGATERAAQMGDRAWRDLVASHHGPWPSRTRNLILVAQRWRSKATPIGVECSSLCGHVSRHWGLPSDDGDDVRDDCLEGRG